MKKKLIALLLCMTMVAVTFTACGGSGGGEAGGDGAEKQLVVQVGPNPETPHPDRLRHGTHLKMV